MNLERKQSHVLHRITEDDDTFETYVGNLLSIGNIEPETATEGIAKQIVSKGVESLSDAQLTTFVKFGLNEHNYVEECERCAIEIPWSEMLEALDDGYCSYCRHQYEKE